VEVCPESHPFMEEFQKADGTGSDGSLYCYEAPGNGGSACSYSGNGTAPSGLGWGVDQDECAEARIKTCSSNKDAECNAFWYDAKPSCTDTCVESIEECCVARTCGKNNNRWLTTCSSKKFIARLASTFCSDCDSDGAECCRPLVICPNVQIRNVIGGVVCSDPPLLPLTPNDFTISDPVDITVYYPNGTEIARTNLPEGVTFDLSSTVVIDDKCKQVNCEWYNAKINGWSSADCETISEDRSSSNTSISVGCRCSQSGVFALVVRDSDQCGSSLTTKQLEGWVVAVVVIGAVLLVVGVAVVVFLRGFLKGGAKDAIELTAFESNHDSPGVAQAQSSKVKRVKSKPAAPSGPARPTDFFQVVTS